MLGGLDPVEDRPQPLALLVGQPLGDAVGPAVGDEDHEPAGQRDLLGEPRTLGADRVLGHLHDDLLLGPKHLLDPRWITLGLDVLRIEVNVAAVEDRVLRRGDVDERRLHAGQDVLHPTEVDVAVDLSDVVRWPRHVVLHQGATLEHCDLGGVGRDVHAHQVAAHRPALAFSTPPRLEHVVVELYSGVGQGLHRRGRRCSLLATALTALTALTGAVLAAAAAAGATALAALTRSAVGVGIGRGGRRRRRSGNGVTDLRSGRTPHQGGLSCLGRGTALAVKIGQLRVAVIEGAVVRRGADFIGHRRRRAVACGPGTAAVAATA